MSEKNDPAAQPTRDPFQTARQQDGVLRCPIHGENITMILRHADVKSSAADWQTFSSDAPFRVPIPSEEAVRSTRQLPIETDPPDHAAYRDLTEPFFQRAKQPAVIVAVKQLIDGLVTAACELPQLDAVADFALPLQSRALTYLLNMPESEAEIWIGWGIHVFKVTGGEFKRGNLLEDYLNAQFDRAAANPGADFFSALSQATFQDRRLTRDECLGFANLAFAGGRDTVIHSITSILAHLAEHPADLAFLRDDPRRITLASEEFFRVFMPLTQIGRVCPHGAGVQGVEVAAGERVGLCWSSANFDESVFEQPAEVRLDRRPNPHVSFGYRGHLCQGAAHARLVVRSLLETLCQRVDKIEILHAIPQVECESQFTRQVGFQELQLKLSRMPSVVG